MLVGTLRAVGARSDDHRRRSARAAARIVYNGTKFDFDPQNPSPTLAPLFERIAGETLKTLSSPTPNQSRTGF
ncbi:hypothetical protein SAMN02787076_03929 [Rhizobacter sp. OV335]|nr:hypothetical protein SAMN02787076_03929 [Rhizobacter sp. OV335]